MVRVPGAWELPVAARALAAAGRHAALVALGCVVRGDTRHYEQVADGCAEGLMRVALDTGVPVINGVLAVERFEDAEARAGGSHGNKGEEAALVAIEMADLLEKLQAHHGQPRNRNMHKAAERWRRSRGAFALAPARIAGDLRLADVEQPTEAALIAAVRARAGA